MFALGKLHLSPLSLALLVQRTACFQPLLQRCCKKGNEIGLVANGANADCVTLVSQDKSPLLLHSVLFGMEARH